MKVDFTILELEPLGKSTTGSACQSGTTGISAGRESDRPSGSISTFDSTRFSLDPSQLQSLEAQVLAQPEIRRAKVRSLQRAIGNGEYSVPVDQVADALVSALDEVQVNAGAGAGKR
jgi:flagellar biosynthesis anti-sigma factor FlgM